MNLRRKLRVLQAGKSPSKLAMERTYKRAILNGGVTQDFSANVENIREISRKLGYNILKTNIPPDDSGKNLINYSEDFTNIMYNKNGMSITPNVVTAPNSTLTASKFIESNTNAFHFMPWTTGVSIGQTCTISAYYKAAERTKVRIVSQMNATQADVQVNLTTGATIVAPSATVSNLVITDATDGWWRISFSLPVTKAGQTFIELLNASNQTSYLGDGVSGIYIWGTQIELGSTVTTYEKTARGYSTPATTNANFLYVPSSYGEGKNFAQVHNKRNLLQWSEAFQQDTWIKNISVIQSNQIANPVNGLEDADLLRQDGVANPNTRRVSYNVSLSGIYTISCYAKKKDLDGIRLVVSDGTLVYGASFNTVTGDLIQAVNSIISYKTEVLQSQWFRFSVTVNVVGIIRLDIAIANSDGIGILNDTNTFGNYIWGAQLEQGAYATPYQKTVAAGDGIVDFNFTRATSATVTNKLGVIENSCYNLLSFSEQFDNAVWSKTDSTIIANSVIAPNGTLTAESFMETATTNVHQISFISNTLTAIGLTYTYSVYVKPNGRDIVSINFLSSRFGTNNTFFDLSNGIITSQDGVSNATIEILDNGWSRISITSTAIAIGGVSNECLMRPVISGTAISYLGDISKGLYIWGAQLTQGSTPRPYLRTTNRLNVPKLDYSRGLGEPELLIERASTNLALWSATFDNASWLKNVATVTANATISPDNTLTADILSQNGIASTFGRRVEQNVSLSGTHTLSCYVKKKDLDGIRILIVDNSLSGHGAAFNTTTGDVISILNTAFNVKSEELPNEWFRFSVSANIANIVRVDIALADASGSQSLNDTNTFGNYIWGAQVEAGSTATTYIPTTTATVTRNAETSYVDLWNNSLLNRTNWTLFWEGYLYDGSGTGFSFVLSDSTSIGTNTNQIGWDDSIRPFYNISNIRTNSVSGAVSNTFNKFIIQYNNGVANFFINGINVWDNRSIPVFDYRYLILNSGGSTFTTNKIALFNRTLTDEECINLTT